MCQLLIDIIAQTGKPIILSAGLIDIEQIIEIKDFIKRIWRKHGITQELAVLHCVSSYPTHLHEANLLAIRQLQDRLKLTIGYSDHTLGIEAAILSVVLGARIIEKHFTLDKHHSDFHDHQLSADPKELSLMVRRIKETIKLLGNGEKNIQNNEKNMILKVRRSIVASHYLTKGAVLQHGDITWLRPGGGLPPGQEKEIIGKRIKRFIRSGEYILISDLEPV